MWKTLRLYPNFARLFSATLISAIGNNIHRIALMVMVYSLTEEALWVSLALGIQLITSVIIGPLLSAWADVQERRKLLVLSDILRAPVVLLIPLLGIRSLPLLLILVICMEILRILHDPVSVAVIPELVPESSMDAANGLMLFAVRFAEVVFVGLAGLLVAAAGTAVAFWIDAGTFLASGLLLLGLPQMQVASDAERGYWARVQGGINHIRRNPIIRRTVGTLACAALFGSVESVLGVVLAVSVMQVGSAGFGIMEAGMAFGAILGTVMILQLTKKISRERIFLFGLLGFGVIEAAIGLFPAFSWVITAYFISGVLNMAFLIPARSILMINTPSELRTRTFAAFGAVMNSAVLAGTLLGGALEKPLGAPTVFLLAGAAVFLVTFTTTFISALSCPKDRAMQHAAVEVSVAS